MQSLANRMVVLTRQLAVKLQDSFHLPLQKHCSEIHTHFCWALIARRELQQLSWSRNCSNTPIDSQDTCWRLQQLFPAIILSSLGKKLASTLVCCVWKQNARANRSSRHWSTDLHCHSNISVMWVHLRCTWSMATWVGETKCYAWKNKSVHGHRFLTRK